MAGNGGFSSGFGAGGGGGDQGKRREEAAAVAALATALAAAKSEFKGLQDAANADLFAKSPIAKAKADIAALTAEFKRLSDAEKQSAKDAAALADLTRELRLKDLNAKAQPHKDLQDRIGKQLGGGGEGDLDRQSKIEAAYSKAGDFLAAGASKVLDAAEYLGTKALGLVKQGLEFGVSVSAAREKQREILNVLTHGQGEIALQVRTKIAGDTGADPGIVGDRVRALILAGFKRGDTELLLHAAADLGEVKGQGKAEAFLSTLERLSHRGSTTARDLKAITGAGVDLADVFGRLGQKGETLKGFEARLKDGKVAALDFARAAAESIEGKIGGISGKGLEASLNRARIAARGLFSGMDTGPLDELAGKVADVLGSKSGGELKGSLTEIGNAIIGVTKNITKDDIASAFSRASEAAHQLSTFIKASADAASDLVKFGREAGIIGESAKKVDRGPRQYDTSDGKTLELDDFEARDKALRAAGDGASKGVEAPAGAVGTGKAIDDGMAQGIDDNAAKIKEAGARAAKGAVTGANEELGIHSPSRVAIEQGRYYGAGWEEGIDRAAPGVAGAAARLAGGVGRAGTAGGPAAIGGGGSAGTATSSRSLSVTFAPVIHMGSGSAEEYRRAESFLADFYAAKILPAIRLAQRDESEFANGGP